MSRLHLDSTGSLNFAEVLVLMVKKLGIDGIDRAFQSYDVDRSGNITSDELKQLHYNNGHFLNKKQINLMIQAVDVNDDGQIDYHEFLVSLI